MNLHKLVDFYRGWFIGDFHPTLIKTKAFEIGILKHKKNEYWAAHYHKVATEYNVLISGSMILNETPIGAGDIFIIEPGEIAQPTFLEDCTLLVIKTPSVTGDKYEL